MKVLTRKLEKMHQVPHDDDYHSNQTHPQEHATDITLFLIQIAELSSPLTSELVNSDWKGCWQNWTEPHPCLVRTPINKNLFLAGPHMTHGRRNP